MKYLAIASKDKTDLETGTILRFGECEFRNDFKQWVNVFEIIGNPVEDTPTYVTTLQ